MTTSSIDCKVDGLPVGDGLSKRLWQENEDLVTQALYHPFIRALGRGDLPRECFLHYIGQDAFFLGCFGKAYALALAKCSLEDNETFEVISTLLKGVHRELQLHGQYLRTWGVSPDDPIKPTAATLAYTNFLLEIANADHTGVAEVVAAMVPCARLYGYLGCQLAQAWPQAHHDYVGWVETYSSNEYLSAPEIKERLLDRIGVSVPYEALSGPYRRAMELEVDFFSAHPSVPRVGKLGVLMVDFDDTCTVKDTVSTLLKVAVDCAAKRAESQEMADSMQSELEEKIDWLVENYRDRFKELLSEILPDSSSEGAKRSKEHDLELVAGFIARLSDFDESMNHVVIESKVLSGIDQAAVRAAGEQVPLSPGCLETLRRALDEEVPVHILSVNWSSELIKSCLRLPTASLCVGQNSPRRSLHGSPVIHANELEYGADGLSTGELVKYVQCARDKGKVFEDVNLLEACAACKQESADEPRPHSVYIGDSCSDLLPLLGADFGIVVGNNPLLRRALKEFNVELRPLCTAPTYPAEGSCTHPVLYEAGSWWEISGFLFGPPPLGKEEEAGAEARTDGPVSQKGEPHGLPRVITIAGSDSGGGAGIQADLKTFTALGVFGMTAITALTAQNTMGVQGVRVVEGDFLEQQLDAVLGDIGVDAVKTGMVPTASSVRVVAQKLHQYGVPHVVVDPVMVSTSGSRLALEDDVVVALREELIPLAEVLTPNLKEASVLLGGRSIHSVEDMEAAARELHQLGPKYVLLKGGHLGLVDGQPPAEKRECVDVLYDGSNMWRLPQSYVVTPNLHGTGCTLASAIACGLAKGQSVLEAVRGAQKYLWGALWASRNLRIGGGPQSPFNHGYDLRSGKVGQSHAQGQEERKAPAIPNGCTVLPHRASNHKTSRDYLGVYVVTDPACNQKRGRSMVEAVKLAVAGGATVVQIREKDMEGGDFVREAREVMQICRPLDVPVIINDRVDVALAVDADGVHVGQGDIPAALVRTMIGPDRLLGVSVKDPHQARQALEDGADYVGAGAVYPTGTKDASVIGIKGLEEICSSSALPVVAIGGVTASNAAEAVKAGCAGVAVVSAVFASQDPTRATRELKDIVEQTLSPDLC